MLFVPPSLSLTCNLWWETDESSQVRDIIDKKLREYLERAEKIRAMLKNGTVRLLLIV